MLSQLSLIPLLLLSLFSEAQTVVSLVSDTDKMPISWAQVSIWDTTTVIYSTGTDGRGNVLIPDDLLSKTTPRIVLFQLPDYQEQCVTLLQGKAITLFFKPIISTFDECIITGQLSTVSVHESVQKARIIDRATIDAKGAVNLRDVLQSELTIRISQDQVLGSGMNLQGQNGQNVKIMVDGVPVIGRLDGEIDLSQINLANVERIELIEGPSSVSFGSNALAGTINIITKKREKAGQQLQLNSYVESVGVYNLDGRFTTNVRQSQLQLYGIRNFFDGWSNNDPFFEFPQEKIADSGRFQSWKPKINYQAGLKWTIPFKRITLTPYIDAFYEQIRNKGLPRAPYFNTAFDDYYRTFRLNEGVLVDVRINQSFKMNGVVAYNFYERIKNTYIKNLNTLDQVLTTVPGDQDSTRFSAFMSRFSWVKFQQDSTFNFELGVDFNHETASGQRITNGAQSITELALFGSSEWKWRKWLLKPGIRYTYNSVYHGAITPALHLKYVLKSWTFRASVASGFRSPVIKELYIDFVDINHNIQGNMELKPEQSLHYQGWLSTNQKLGKYPVKIELNGYFQQVKQKISLAQAPDGVTYSYFNLNDFEATGIQTMLDFKPGKHRFLLGAALVGTRSNLTERHFSYSPEVTANAQLYWKKADLTFSSFYKYTGRVMTYFLSSEGEPITSFIQDYQLLDVNVSRSFWAKRIVLAFGAKNLLNVQQVGASNSGGPHSGSATSTPIAWGRSVYVKCQLNIHYKK